MLHRRSCVPSVLLLAAVAGAAHAQWTSVNLHPAGATWSGLSDVSGGQQGGLARFGSVVEAGMWAGTAASWTSLHPVGATGSEVRNVSLGRQAGEVIVGGQGRPARWNGSPASVVDLTPAGATGGGVLTSYGDFEGGTARWPGGGDRAGVWNGSAVTWVSLHPPGLEALANSYIFAMFGPQQGGSVASAAATNGNGHAALWSGSASSWIDLHPPSVNGSSVVQGITNGAQVGDVRWNIGSAHHAALWRGTAASWVDIHPSGFDASNARDVWGTQIAGEVTTPTTWHAGIWTDLTAASFVDLHAFLPPGYSASSARGIYSDAAGTYVAGYAVNQTTGQDEAFMWIGPPPAVICRPDLTYTAIPGGAGYGVPSGIINNDDFFYYIIEFTAGNLTVCDMTTTAIPGSPGYGVPDGVLNNDDFFFYLTIFAAGC